MKACAVAWCATLLCGAAGAASFVEVAPGAGAFSDSHGAGSVRVALSTELPWRHVFAGGSELVLLAEGSVGRVWQDSDQAWLATLSPLLQWRFPREAATPFVEAGIGGALFSRDRLGPVGLGQHFQFMDRLGAGVDFDDWRLVLRYLHYSQADMSKPNDGLDLIELGFARRFF